ncbi:sorting nexin-7-like [Plodia interpunctella]|uniref:sorting nexin-7-like n=1 Tax=Plodia interpunctella TaxID=58824 RepID=UPI00236846AC|nr:sorting nexin-7-like [Plodia interpunctella]XP_053623058.1 sorting nexin-7-like [Plodia interpunctella]XP_053623059.1 sorting nexin-7-like [Plodia interpunctella]
MASESSSAVLDLNDGDETEETEASVVEDLNEDLQDAVPLIMDTGCDIAVKVDAPMKQMSTLETYVTYRVRCVCARWHGPPAVRRRYNHFKVLHQRLSSSFPLVAAPPLPPLHSARQQLDRYSASFVAIRTLGLNAFLDRVARHPILTHSEDFRLFLTLPDEELEKVFKSESSALNLWGLSSALYGSGEAKPTNGARVKDPEFSSIEDYLTSLEQKLTTLCTLTTKLHKGLDEVSNDFMGMKRCCDAWASGAGGHTALAAGALAAGAARVPRPAPRPPPPRALLPMLVAYSRAHREKLKRRQALHAAYVAGNTSDDLHNRLEQSSEALRSELSDWLPKTRSDIKSILIDVADSQVNRHTLTLQAWEHALKLSTETDHREIFKTVSKTAVHNLSPSKCDNNFESDSLSDIEHADPLDADLS